jgi:hypothetical protein
MSEEKESKLKESVRRMNLENEPVMNEFVKMGKNLKNDVQEELNRSLNLVNEPVMNEFVKMGKNLKNNVQEELNRSLNLVNEPGMNELVKIKTNLKNNLQEELKTPKLKKEPSTPSFLFKKENDKFLDDSDSSDVSSDIETEWSDDIERILEEINYNCSVMSDYHKQVYLVLVGQLIYFRVPLIVLSSVNSILAIGLSAFIHTQTVVSGINSVISLMCAIISSVELFLQIQKRSEVELLSHREYYLLGVKISSMLKLDRKRRQTKGLVFLNSIIADYTSLYEASNVNNHDLNDKLIMINEKNFTMKQTPSMNPIKMILG